MVWFRFDPGDSLGSSPYANNCMLAGMGNLTTSYVGSCISNNTNFEYEIDNSGTSGNYATTALPGTGTWFCTINQGYGNGDQAIWNSQQSNYNAPTGLSTGTNGTDSALTNFYVGFQSPSTEFGTNSQYPGLAIADVALWQGTLSSNDIGQLLAGLSPLAVRSNNLLLYYPLNGTLMDLGRGKTPLQIVGGFTPVYGAVSPVNSYYRKLAQQATSYAYSYYPIL
jgi:hypothetical protein